ncbi:MAG: MBL fold metallo-hydrolase [Chloroflexota bacterium]
MIEQIRPDIYRIEVPLPQNPLRALNAYLVKGAGRYLLIDTGMNREECREALMGGLTELGVDPGRTEIFLTHIHTDHTGLVGAMADDVSKVMISEPDAAVAQQVVEDQEGRWRKTLGIYVAHGFPDTQALDSLMRHPARRYGINRHIDFTIVGDGDIIEIGAYAFRCVATPGHTPGHMCLYEAAEKILVAGDHILFDITPNITFWSEMEDPLKSYLASLEKVAEMDVEMVLPGHRRRMKDHRARIREIQEHHRRRLGEVLAALGAGARNCLDIIPRMTWDVPYRTWEEFPSQQKWFAFGEALAHLVYLEHRGSVRAVTQDDRINYFLA